MARRSENDEESLARKWLRRQGHDDIRRLSDDPPDFVVDGDCAVEVTRLSQRIVVGTEMSSKAEEEARIPLRDQIARVLARLGRPGNEGRSWAIDCDYDFAETLPDCRTVDRQISRALAPLLKPYDATVVDGMHEEHLNFDKHAGEISCLGFPHLCLACGICLDLTEFGHGPASFFLQNVSDGEGCGVAAELAKGIRNRISAKSKSVRDQDKLRKYGAWWLILVDHIGFLPLQVLSEHELSGVRNQDYDFWDRVVVVSSKEADWHYDLRPR